MKAEDKIQWVTVGQTDDFPRNAGVCVKVGGQQVAVFRFAGRDEWYACQNMCPHRMDMVLSRGIIGDRDGIPKVACPQHKKTFSLCNGENLEGEGYSIRTYPVRVEGDRVAVGTPL